MKTLIVTLGEGENEGEIMITCDKPMNAHEIVYAATSLIAACGIPFKDVAMIMLQPGVEQMAHECINRIPKGDNDNGLHS